MVIKREQLALQDPRPKRGPDRSVTESVPSHPTHYSPLRPARAYPHFFPLKKIKVGEDSGDEKSNGEGSSRNSSI